MAALACALPFRTVFAKQLGISATAVGVIFLAIPFFKILTNPLFGLLVDHFKKFRLTISVLMLIVAVTHVIMVFIPPLKTSEDLTIILKIFKVLLSVLTIIDLLPVYKLQIGEVKYSPNICKDIWSLLSKLDIAINIFIVFTIGVLSGLLWNYQFWFMEEIGASQVLLGLSQTFECVAAEVPCFLISGWVIRKIGYINCNSLTLFCFGLRYLCFAFMWDPWMTLPVGFFNGPCFGIFFAAMTMYGKTEAPPGTEATVQSLLAMSFEGVGAGMGSILGGIGFDKFGSRKTFLISAVNPWLGLLIDFLQGPCFGTFYTAMTSYAKKIAPEGTEATVQGLASGTFEGLGVATGSLLGGYGFRTFGGRKHYSGQELISFAFGVINSLIN
ncbi:Major facilitator superfamily like protein [Argiope bruennichi]|uniref:Major facilitator superfamily like protein n=1 Tax=Argiope bruennichi TaxID=94029 RepID=A0A8T0E705_ARGBR|nr:Major facilitator superfamily like protein [Argiope bruennichi]